MGRQLSKVRESVFAVVESLFKERGDSQVQRALYWCTATVVYLFGLLKWAAFSNYGHMTFTAGDWYKEHAFYSVLNQAFSQGIIPYHTNVEFHGTYRFLALPEIVFSPQVFVLYFTDNIGRFILFHTLVLYTVGFLGCLAISKYYKLSSYSFSLMSILLLFNGHITSHLAVGHTMWGGYFFLPWLFLALVRLSDGSRRPIRSILAIAMVLFLILLQGSLHLFVGCLVFLVVFVLFNPSHLKTITAAVAAASVLSAYRLVPALLSFGDHELYFQSGYPTLRDLFDALTVVRRPSIDMVGGITGALYWWELDVFIGFSAVLVVAIFGVYYPFFRDRDVNLPAQIFAPVLVMAVLSISHFFSPIAHLPIPLATVERVPSRFIVFALVWMTISAGVSSSRFLHRQKNRLIAYSIALFILLQTSFELMTHLRFWNVQNVNASLPSIPALAIRIVDSPGDRLFETVVNTSFVITVAALLVWLGMTVAARRNAEDTPKKEEA